MLKQVVFLDRDGVINRDSPDYIKSWGEFEFLPGSLEAIARLTRAGMTVILITNQSAINRGIIAPDVLDYMHRMLRQSVSDAGGKITDIFFCPHHPDEGCGCRKPMPGMIMKAVEKHGISLASACMIGDSAKDIECAKNAGCDGILVKTGNGEAALPALIQKDIHPAYVASNLYRAAEWLLEQGD